ncbi:MAG: DNA ligase D [Nitrospira sp.]|nr:DNA ligase D [Nitrospira sp.]
MARELLKKYNEKRDFGITAEPRGKAGKRSSEHLRFVIQLHEATRTHYDLRLEWDGVMKSWAVTRGPSYDPADKRLAVRTEDHPMDYNEFEGVIPEKQYGAGPVMIWDEGVWMPEEDPAKMEKKGHLTFSIDGFRMKGQWHLVRMHTPDKRENWLLIKSKDDFALSKSKNDGFLKREHTSVVTGRTMAEILKASLGKTTQRRHLRKPMSVHQRPFKTGAKKSSTSLTSLMKQYPGPELATLVDKQPNRDVWVHEIKYDGYRLMAFVDKGTVILRTRGGQDWTHKFTPLAKAIAQLTIESAVFDLEACVLNERGQSDFGALQAALSDNNQKIIHGYLFDLLYLDGEDLTNKALIERKVQLSKILKAAQAPLHFSDHLESSPDLLEQACEIGAEGLVSKKKDSLYQGRRTNDWVKSKCGLEQEFVIGGFMPAKNHTKAIGALLLGYYKNKQFTYAGKVGTGFSQQLAKDIYQRLIPLQIMKSPFGEKVGRGRRDYIFVKPEILCEISFIEWTSDGHIRHGSLKGLREDKNPIKVVEEIPKPIEQVTKDTKPRSTSKDEVSYRGVKITHPDRIVFPDTKITKGDVAEYYDRIAPLMVPFVRSRLISLLRCTDGIGGECFFQRNPMQGMGDEVYSRSLTHKGNKHDYIYVQNEVGILQLVQMGTMELHAWQSSISTQGKPDQIIFDLDPDAGVPFEAVKLAAQDIRNRLKRLGLVSFPRLSGGKGIHVVAPIKPEHGWEEIKEFARGFAETMVREIPGAYVANMSKKRRSGKIFVDFFRNDFSATAIAPFSLRARAGAPIAWPVSWTDLKKYKTASAIQLHTIDDKLIQKAQKVSAEFLSISQTLKL